MLNENKVYLIFWDLILVLAILFSLFTETIVLAAGFGLIFKLDLMKHARQKGHGGSLILLFVPFLSEIYYIFEARKEKILEKRYTKLI